SGTAIGSTRNGFGRSSPAPGRTSSIVTRRPPRCACWKTPGSRSASSCVITARTACVRARSARRSPRTTRAVAACSCRLASAKARQAILNEGARLLQLPCLDRVEGLEGERPDGAGAVVAAVLREGAGADHEHVRHVPALQVLVDRAGRRKDGARFYACGLRMGRITTRA